MDVSQPRDPKHPIYRLVDEYLEVGDLKVIQLELKVSQAVVSNVKCGKARSKRIWKRIIEKVLWRKEQRIQMANDLEALRHQVESAVGNTPQGG